ncbi:HAD family hydrolase [Candidatus Roizmanbacteria bacterium]|nr:HAD family hydrolase [Candidatus Roizmanbacteria bacterium]
MDRVPIHTIIFDVDGTLYHSPLQLKYDLHLHWIRQLSQHLRIPHDEAERQYSKAKITYKSSTKSLVALGVGTIAEVARKADAYLLKNVKHHLKRDRKLVRLIKKLRAHYTLSTLRNGTLYGTRQMLLLLGFENNRRPKDRGFGPFDHILPTAELDEVKPAQKIFSHAIKTIGVPADRILIIGDRVDIDLLPAKKLGMKTALVTWGEKPKDLTGVDAMMETIYDIEQLL